ncbi:hypothetical protein ACQKL5_13180 [Peribacillus sp. NPDC097675]|uniref:hypothetical protein n=1 Tax=Peribacillus sp. NPDC097675 TaxID=3390618 RepID=UPI003D055ABB
MGKETSEKAKWWRFFIWYIPFCALWFFIFYWINRQLHHTEGILFYGTPASSYWVYYISAALYGMATFGIYFSIKQGIHQKSFLEFKKNALTIWSLVRFPILISLPFLYLAVTHALVVTDEKVQLSSFWRMKDAEYSWKNDVQSVAIDYSIIASTKTPHQRYFNGKYILHFKDGKKIDMWDGVLEGNLPAIKKIDQTIQKKDIPFTVRQVPSEENVERFFNNKDSEFIRELYSR